MPRRPASGSIRSSRSSSSAPGVAIVGEWSGGANRPRFWGKHAVAAALDNPDRKVLRAWATREAAGFMRFPKDVQVTLAEAPDLGRLVPHDAPHQGVVIEVGPLEDSWLDDVLADVPERAILLVLDQVTDPHNVGAILRSAAAFGAAAIVTQDRHSPPESGALAKAASGALERVPWVRVVNLARALDEIGESGFRRIGLAGDKVQKTEKGRQPGAHTLLRTIVGQQVSVAAARSMWSKLEAAFGSPPDLARLLTATDEELRGAGMSRQK